jgi:Fibronectin type III domain
VITHEPKTSTGFCIRISFLAAVTCGFLIPGAAHLNAQTLVNVTLAWNPSAASDIAGYYLYQGAASGDYTNRIDTGNVTSSTVSALTPGLNYYFAVSAYDATGLESALSSEISYSSSAVNASYYGISLNDPTQALADSDGDGLANLVEYAVGGDPFDPTDANDGIRTFITEAGTNAYLTMQYKWRSNSAALQLQYFPEVSADKLTWYSDSTDLALMSVTPIDAQFSWVTVQDTTPINPWASRYARLRVVLGSLESATPVCIGSDTLLQGDNLTLFSQRMVRPVLCAGTVAELSSTILIDTNAAFVAGEFGTNATSAYVEFDNGMTFDILQTTANTLILDSGAAPALTAGATYRIRPQFTVASLFGTNDETGLAAGPSAAQADNILLYNAKSQSALTIFYYSDPGVSAWQGWVRADTMLPDGNEVIGPGQGFMLRRILPGDLHLYSCGPIKTTPTQVEIQPGYNLLGTWNGLTLSGLDLYTGSTTNGMISGMNPSGSDNLVMVNSEGSVRTFFYYYQPGVFQGWVNADGYTSSDNVVLPPGSAFFIYRQGPSPFTWIIPAIP